MKIKVCGPPFALPRSGLGERNRRDKERGNRTSLRKVNLFRAWVIWLKNHCAHLICSSEVLGDGGRVAWNHHWRWWWSSLSKSCHRAGMRNAPRHSDFRWICKWRLKVGYKKSDEREENLFLSQYFSCPTEKLSFSFTHVHHFLQFWTSFCLCLTRPPQGNILLPSASQWWQLELNPAGLCKVWHFETFFCSPAVCLTPWEMREKTQD